jgi:hypothetical protein
LEKAICLAAALRYRVASKALQIASGEIHQLGSAEKCDLTATQL